MTSQNLEGFGNIQGFWPFLYGT